MTRSVRVSFYVTNFQETPSAHAKDLGICPDRVKIIGEIQSISKLPAKWNEIEVNSDAREEDDLNSHIRNILEKLGDLEALKENLNNMRKIYSDYVVGIDVAVYVENGRLTPKCALFIENETLKKIAELGCVVGFDLYAPAFSSIVTIEERH